MELWIVFALVFGPLAVAYVLLSIAKARAARRDQDGG